MLVAAGIAGLAWSLLRRASGSVVFAHAATAVFVACSWYRLFQLRPQVVSIAAALVLYRLVL